MLELNITGTILLKKIKVTHNILKKWMKISEAIYIPDAKKHGVIEEFDGYFKKKNMTKKLYLLIQKVIVLFLFFKLVTTYQSIIVLLYNI